MPKDPKKKKTRKRIYIRDRRPTDEQLRAQHRSLIPRLKEIFGEGTKRATATRKKQRWKYGRDCPTV